MIIAVDLDDVLADSLTSFIEFYNKHYSPSLNYTDFIKYSLNEIRGISREQENKILEHFDESKYFDDIKPVKNSAESIEKLSKRHKIVIITSRTKEKKDKTIEWVKRFISGINDIFFIRENYSDKPKTKAEICKEINADIIIEDNLSYAQNCAENKIKVLLFDYPWNQNNNLHPLIKRVRSWEEILEVIEEKHHPQV